MKMNLIIKFKQKSIYIYKRFLVLWCITFTLPLIINVLYVIFIRYIFIKLCSDDSNIIANPQVNNIIIESPDPKKFYDVIPTPDHTSNDDFVPIPFIIIIPTIIAFSITILSLINDYNGSASIEETLIAQVPTTTTQEPLNMSVNNDHLEDKQVTVYDIYNSDLQKDMKHAVYGPSYIGKKNYIDIFQLHLDVRTIIANHIQQENAEVLSQQDVVQIIQREIHNYIITQNVFQGLTVQSLQNTQHTLNLLIGELLNNSIFAEDKEKFLLHNIAKCLIYEIIYFIEGSANFEDSRILEIIAFRFMQYDND